MNWPAFATLVAVVLAWVVIHLLRRRHVNFSLITVIALLIGIPIGLVSGFHVEYIRPIGTIYVDLLLAAVAPLVFISIISAVTSLGSIAKLRTIGVRSVVWLLGFNAIGVALALGAGLLVEPGRGLHATLDDGQPSNIAAASQNFGTVLVNLFPTNIIENLRGNNIVPIIIVAVVLSVAYLSLAERKPAQVKPFRDITEALKLVIFKAVGYIIRATPYAIVALTVQIVGQTTNLRGQFWSLIALLGLTWGVCFAHTYLVNGVAVRVFANLNPVSYFRKIFPAQITAFTTQSSAGTLPVTTRQLTAEVGVHPEIAHFTAPLGTTIGMPGCAGIWPVLIAVWGINAYDIQYSPADWVRLALLSVVVSIGVAGVPNTATVAAATVFTAAGLPLEFVAVTVPISIIADMARTVTNVTTAATSATVVARQTKLLDDDIFAGRTVFADAELIGEDETPHEDSPERAADHTAAHRGGHNTEHLNTDETVVFTPEEVEKVLEGTR